MPKCEVWQYLIEESFELENEEDRVMNVEFGKTEEYTNTKLAPLGLLLAYYNEHKVLEPLKSLGSEDSQSNLEGKIKLYQIFVSILSGCRYISEVNTKLRPERIFAQVNRIEQFCEQSTLSLALNGLSQMNIERLEVATQVISKNCSRVKSHDWRGHLLLDFDLSGLPCSKKAEGGEKGYFAGKKTVRVGS